MPSPFLQKAQGGERSLDRDRVHTALGLLLESSQTCELRTLPSGRSKIVKGNDLPSAVEAAWELSDEKGLYWCLNPVRPDLIGAASNKDVLYRRWLLIDVDTQRKDKDSNATEDEKRAASRIVDALLDYLCGVLGWSHPIVADSGNGWHLYSRIDLDNSKLSQQLVKQVLITLADKFDTAEVKIDRAVHNSARISKLPGSWARKGPHSEERPHRLASIIYAPEQTIVTVEQLQELAGRGGPPGSNGNGSPFLSYATSARGLDSYVRSAIERECGRLMMTPPGGGPAGGRDNQVNESAFKLGTMASWPEMNKAEAQQAIYQAGRMTGLDEASIIRAFNSGWTDGALQPRSRLTESSINGKDVPPLDPNEKVTIGLDELEIKKVDWLWQDRVARGFISIFAGRTGMAKSFVVCNLAAALSRGDILPFSDLPALPPASTLIISEDPPEYMIGPRLIEMGCVRRMVRFMTWDAMARWSISDMEMLEKAYEECGRPLMIMIDPPTNFIRGKDEHKNSEVRQVLMILVAWLIKHQVAGVFITHVNKAVGKGFDPVERIIGSIAWAAVARITLNFAEDPDNEGQILCGGGKNNLGDKARVLAFKVVKTDVLAKIEWVGWSDTSIEDAMNRVKKKTRGIVATEWLMERFREKREWESDELRRAASEAGISKNALWSPEVNGLPIRKRKRMSADGDSHWLWIADEGWPPIIPDKTGVGNNGHLGNVDTQPVF